MNTTQPLIALLPSIGPSVGPSSSTAFGLNATCRLSTDGPLPISAFRSLACAKCLLFIYLAQPPYNFTVQNVCDDGVLACDVHYDSDCRCDSTTRKRYNLREFVDEGGGRDKAMVEDLKRLRIEPRLPIGFEQTVRQCCSAAERCCLQVLQYDSIPQFRTNPDDESSCPATWDGWQCFNRTAADTTAHQFCPAYIFGMRWSRPETANSVAKHCEPDGHWRTRRGGGGRVAERTDYSQCHREESWLKPLLLCTFVAHCVSIGTVLPALALLTFNRRLKEHEVFIIHRHMLISLLFASLSYIVTATLFMPYLRWHPELFLGNHIVCRALHVLQNAYFRLTSFAWMMAEAMHLYWSLFRSLSQRATLTQRLPTLCWGVPAALTLIYVILTEYFDGEMCHTELTSIWWIRAIILVPCLGCLAVNLLILCVTLQLIIRKLQTQQTSPTFANYVKIFRALFMLMPIFGIHLALVVFDFETDLYDIAKMIVNGLGGCLVAVAVCYTNRAVIHFPIQRSRRDTQRFRRPSSIYSAIAENTETMRLSL